MSFNFVGKRKFSYILSCIILIAGIVSLFVQGLNFGVDFTGGTVFQIQFEQDKEIADLREELGSIGYDGVQIQELENGNFQIRTEFMDQTAQDAFEDELTDAAGSFDVLSANAVGPSVGREILLSGILALIVAVVLMVIYITVRFQWRFALAGNLALFHDILITVGIFSIFQLEVNSNFVAAILTIFGYSINDKIVVFDRIRERLGNVKKDDLAHTVNQSIWSTLRRSIFTSLTTLIPIVCVFFLGGETTKLFVLALIIGIISGAYSSIFVASPLWYDLSMKSKKKRF
ncbi:MAG: protein translocase subunit SecF [Peptococcaceae bacterium]|nr:protein translocase subunit SecF [Peptococcaceae bacterium]